MATKELHNEIKEDEIITEIEPTLRGISSQTYIPNQNTLVSTSVLAATGNRIYSTADFTTDQPTFQNVTDAVVTMTTGKNPVMILVSGSWKSGSANSARYANITIDGTSQGGTDGLLQDRQEATGNVYSLLSLYYFSAPLTAGSHTFRLQIKGPGGLVAVTIQGGAATTPLVFSVIEIT